MAAIFAPPRVTIILLNFVTYTFIDFKIYIYIYIYIMQSPLSLW